MSSGVSECSNNTITTLESKKEVVVVAPGHDQNQMFQPSQLHSCELLVPSILSFIKNEELIIILLLSLGCNRQQEIEDKLGNSAAAFGLCCC
jgi:hypothetical protein